MTRSNQINDFCASLRPKGNADERNQMKGQGKDGVEGGNQGLGNWA